MARVSRCKSMASTVPGRPGGRKAGPTRRPGGRDASTTVSKNPGDQRREHPQIVPFGVPQTSLRRFAPKSNAGLLFLPQTCAGGGPMSAGTGGWLPPLGRNTWYLAILAATALGLTAGGVALLAGSGGGGPSHAAAPDCGLINCGANVPGPSSTISTQSHIGKAHTAVSHPPATSAPPASSAPSQGSTPAAPTVAAAANVSVTFSPDQNRRD